MTKRTICQVERSTSDALKSFGLQPERDPISEVAARRLRQTGWTWCRSRMVGEGPGRVYVVEGGVPRPLKSGPRRGRPTFRGVRLTETVVTPREMRDVLLKWGDAEGAERVLPARFLGAQAKESTRGLDEVPDGTEPPRPLGEAERLPHSTAASCRAYADVARSAEDACDDHADALESALVRAHGARVRALPLDLARYLPDVRR